MPYTYDEFIQKTKKLSDAQREALRAFSMMAGKVPFNNTLKYSSEGLKYNNEDFLKFTKEGEAYTTELKKILPPFIGDNIKNISDDVKPDDKQIYENELKNLMAFVSYMEQGNNFNKFMDTAMYENGRLMGNDAKTYFDLLTVLNDAFGAGINIDAHRQKHADYIAASRQKKAEQLKDDGWEISEKPAEPELTIEQKTKRLEKDEEVILPQYNRTFKDYKDSKLFGRGSDQFDDVGTAMEELKSEIIRLYTYQYRMRSGEYGNPSLENFESLRTDIENVNKAVEKLKTAVNAYYDHKKTDGKNQWNEDTSKIKNKNARKRIEAVKDCEHFADLVSEIMTRKSEIIDTHYEIQKTSNKVLDRFQKEIEEENKAQNELQFEINGQPLNIDEQPKVEEVKAEAPANDKFIINEPEKKDPEVIDNNEYDDPRIPNKEEPVKEEPAKDETNYDFTISGKEDEKFTEAVKYERDAIQQALNEMKQNGNKLNTKAKNTIKLALGAVIATSVIADTGKMALDDENFGREKRAQAQTLAGSKSPLSTMVSNCTTVEELEQLSQKAFTRNGNGLKFEFLSHKSPSVTKSFIDKNPEMAKELGTGEPVSKQRIIKLQ